MSTKIREYVFQVPGQHIQDEPKPKSCLIGTISVAKFNPQ